MLLSSRFLPPHLRLIVIFCAALLLSAPQRTTDLWLIFASLLSIAILLFYRRHALGKLLKRLHSVNLFSLLLWMTLCWQIGKHGIEFSPEGIQTALLICLKMNNIMLLTQILLLDVGEIQLLQGINRLTLPIKLKQLFILTLRYIHLLSKTHAQIDMSMRARGYQPHFDYRTMNIEAQKVSLLLIHAMIKAEKSQMALQARGFKLTTRTVRSSKNRFVFKRLAIFTLFFIVVGSYWIVCSL
jgi:cobalt/nickel transport system permease protein